MNLCIKGCHMTRKIASVTNNEDGSLFVQFEPIDTLLPKRYPFGDLRNVERVKSYKLQVSEHIIILPGEIFFLSNEGNSIDAKNQILDKNLPSLRNRLFSPLKVSGMWCDRIYRRLFTCRRHESSSKAPRR